MALVAGYELSVLLATYLGSPLAMPELSKLAEIGQSGGIIEQRNYYYESAESGWTAVKITPGDLDILIRRVAAQPPLIRDALELAMRWYGMSVGADDPLDSYLAVWIGLEALGPAFNDRVHPAGCSQPCQKCGYSSGGQLARGDAELNHLFVMIAPELLEYGHLQDLKNIRNDIAHVSRIVGDRGDVGEVRESATELFPDLMVCLAKAILTLASPRDAQPGGINSALPRDYKTHPTTMAWVRGNKEILALKPWFGK